MTTATLTDLPVTSVHPHPQNVRRALRGIDELADSIAAEGLHQPVVVAPDGDDRYVVVLGHSRLAAVTQLEWESIPCLVRSDLDSEEKILSAMLAENCARNDLTTVEEGDAFQRLLDLDLSPATVAKRAGRSPKQVADRVTVAKQSEKVRTAVDDGQLSLTDALAMAGFADDHEAYGKIEAAIGTNQFDYALRTAIDVRKNLAEGERVYREALDAGAVELDRDAVPEGHELQRIWRPEEEQKTEDGVRFELSRAARPEYQAPFLIWWRIVPPEPTADEPGTAHPALSPAGPAAVPEPTLSPEEQELAGHLEAAAEHAAARWAHVLAAATEADADLVRWCARQLAHGVVREEWIEEPGLFAIAFPGEEWHWQDEEQSPRLAAEIDTWETDWTVVALWLASVHSEFTTPQRAQRWWWDQATNRALLRDLVTHFEYTLTPSEEWLLEHFDSDDDGDAVT